MTQTIDTARLTLLLNDLRLPAFNQGWPTSPATISGKMVTSSRLPNVILILAVPKVVFEVVSAGL